MNLKIVVFLCMQYFLGTSMGNELTAEFVSQLPATLYLHSAIYDGSDSIYIFGGVINGSSISSNIYRYSLSNSSVSTVGNLPYNPEGGSVQKGSNGNILYIGGDSVQTFDVVTLQTTHVAFLPYYLYYGSTVKYDNQVIIVGGMHGCDKILSFDTVTNDVTEVGTLPSRFCDVTASNVLNQAFLFGGDYSPLMTLNLDTFETETLNPIDYPSFKSTSSVTVRQKYIYVGLGQTNASGRPTQGIYQFDTDTFKFQYIPVSNFFSETEVFSERPTIVYVEKENRIYVFGGRSYFDSNQTFIDRDEIWYLDLNQLDTTDAPTTEISTATTSVGSTMDPDIFDCKNRTDGSYPHPSDCAKFIICRDEQMETFECPPPLLFDPLLGACHWPDNVDCGLTCVDKPDGPYPHPHDCALFIDCHGGKLDVFKCPEGLLFDPIFKTCRYADLVDCEGK